MPEHKSSCVHVRKETSPALFDAHNGYLDITLVVSLLESFTGPVFKKKKPERLWVTIHTNSRPQSRMRSSLLDVQGAQASLVARTYNTGLNWYSMENLRRT